MDRELSCGQLMKRIHDELERRANNALKQSGLTMVQAWVLLSLSEQPDKTLSMKQLERALNVSQSTCSGIVSRLEAKGFVESEYRPDDLRIKHVTITPAGEASKNATALDVENMDRILFEGFTDEERELYRSFLERTCENLT